MRQAVVVWQAADASEMHETRLEAPGLLGVSRLLTGVPVPQVVLPGAGEFTDGCGSSLGSVRNGSYHVIGMHIGFKDGVAVLDGYTALTSYKLQLLQMAIESAKNDNAITKAQYNQLSAHSNDAAKHFGQGLYGPTLNDLQHLDDTIHKISIVPQPFNHEGDMEMRTLNLIFTIQNKVVPLSK